MCKIVEIVAGIQFSEGSVLWIEIMEHSPPLHHGSRRLCSFLYRPLA